MELLIMVEEPEHLLRTLFWSYRLVIICRVFRYELSSEEYRKLTPCVLWHCRILSNLVTYEALNQSFRSYLTFFWKFWYLQCSWRKWKIVKQKKVICGHRLFIESPNKFLTLVQKPLVLIKIVIMDSPISEIYGNLTFLYIYFYTFISRNGCSFYLIIYH